MRGVLEVVIVDIMIRDGWPTNGLEGFLECQLFVCDVAALLPRQLYEFMAVAGGHGHPVQ